MEREEVECSICAGTENDDEATVTLDCGHTFHCKCVVEWFRFQNVTCPNCRSDRSCAVWTRTTQRQRIAAMRRRKAKLEPHVVRKLDQLDRARSKALAQSRELRAFRTEHKEVIKAFHALQRRKFYAQNREACLRRDLAALVVPSVPFVQFEGWDVDDEDGRAERYVVGGEDDDVYDP